MTSIPKTGARSRKGTVERKREDICDCIGQSSIPCDGLVCCPSKNGFSSPPPLTFLQPVEVLFFFSLSGGGKCLPHGQMSLLDAMDASCRGWTNHAKRFYPRCMVRDHRRFDADMWSNAEDCTAYNRTVYVGFSFCAFFPCNCESKIIYVEFL